MKVNPLFVEEKFLGICYEIKVLILANQKIQLFSTNKQQGILRKTNQLYSF